LESTTSAASAIPPTLLHPIFGKFINDCEKHEPTTADNKLVITLSAAMSSFFRDKKAHSIFTSTRPWSLIFGMHICIYVSCEGQVSLCYYTVLSRLGVPHSIPTSTRPSALIFAMHIHIYVFREGQMSLCHWPLFVWSY
jgi:hypothetical protein